MKLLKNILCIGLVFIMFLHCNYLCLYYALYKINVHDLTETCCVKIVDNCNAHCYLDKKMNEESDGSAKGLKFESKVKLSEFEVANLTAGLYNKDDHNYNIPQDISHTSQYIGEIDHPPQL
ncbi:MAG: hypothetical protein SGI89_09655 [bacterium]|nr:hypothetical protein [bacterium]